MWSGGWLVVWAVAMAPAAEQGGTGAPVANDSAQLWRLDAARTFTVARTSVNAQGEPETQVSVKSLPNPFNPTLARVLRPDGSPVSVSEGLHDVARSSAAADAAANLRSTWARATLFRGLGTGAALGVATVAALAVIPGAILVVNVVGQVPGYDVVSASRSQQGLVVAGMVVAALGLGVFVPAATLAFLGGREVIRAGRSALRATPEGSASSADWPVELAAEVVEAHNRRVLKSAPASPDAPPPAPGSEPPPVIVAGR